MPEYRLKVDEDNKATELRLLRAGGPAAENPHMRAFWAATVSFFIAFFGWFALAPLGLEVAHSMGICENQLFEPSAHPRRPAFLKYKDVRTEELYCRYGKNRADNPTDCSGCSLAAGCESRYNTELLPKCVCTSGTKCANTLADGGVASVASTVLMRVALGSLLVRFGPVNVQTGLLLFGAVWVALSAAITDPWNYILVRFFIGMAGATFVTNQFWCSLMFAPNVIGTANGTAAGWGNLGGGVTQCFIVLVLVEPLKSAGVEADVAWRVAMVVPVLLYVTCAACVKLLCWDTPTSRRFQEQATGGKNSSVSGLSYIEVLKDPRVVVLIFQYSACFGTELAMNNQLAFHFQTYFQLKANDAAALACSFGLMNLFARSLGGILSDVLFAKIGFRGRIWAQFLALLFEGSLLFVFGCVSNDREWYEALIVLIFFSLFVQMAEGTTFAIVPFVNKKQLAVVSALVGAGGNLGAVIAGQAFYKTMEDELLPFKVHSAYVFLFALLSPIFYWPEHGGMFSGPQAAAARDKMTPPDTGGRGVVALGKEACSDGQAGVTAGD